MSDPRPSREAGGAAYAPREPRRTDAAIADMVGRQALPRRSGEMVFHDEWERRAFAMAVALCEQGLFAWDEFRDHLVAAIDASGESPEDPDPAAPGYYEHWLESLEKLLADKGVHVGASGRPPHE